VSKLNVGLRSKLNVEIIFLYMRSRLSKCIIPKFIILENEKESLQENDGL